MGIALGLSSGETPDRFLVALATLSLLSEVAEELPLACFVDDAQWLDDASGQVLGFVARRLLAEAVALVFGVREPSGERALVGLPELLVGGLAEEDTRALLATVIPGRRRRSDATMLACGGRPVGDAALVCVRPDPDRADRGGIRGGRALLEIGARYGFVIRVSQRSIAPPEQTAVHGASQSPPIPTQIRIAAPGTEPTLPRTPTRKWLESCSVRKRRATPWWDRRSRRLLGAGRGAHARSW